MSPRVAGLVLAAGGSRRMGERRDKLLEPVAGRPLLAAPVDALLEAGADPVLVVTGAADEAIRAALAPRPLEFVHHPGWAQGMGSSIACGVRALVAAFPGCEGVLVTLGDLPDLRAAQVRPLLEAFATGGPDRICVPVHAGRRGHPVLFGAACFEALGALRGESGARGILERRAEAVVEVAVGSPAILLDVDTPEALERARRSL